MRKLQHQQSCNVTMEQYSNIAPELQQKLIKTDLPSPSKQMRSLQGKILLLEERGKSIQQFYQNKIAQLKNVLFKQGETKNQLIQQLQRLTIQSQKQRKYVGNLKNKLGDDKLSISLRFAKEVDPNSKCDSKDQKSTLKKGSRGKVSYLFNSNHLKQFSKSKPKLKKYKSQEYFESEYFGNQSQGIPEKIRQYIKNPQK